MSAASPSLQTLPLARPVHDLASCVPIYNKPVGSVVWYRIFRAAAFSGWIVLMTEHHTNRGDPLGMIVSAAARHGLRLFPEIEPRRAVFVQHYDLRGLLSGLARARRISSLELSQPTGFGREQFALIRFKQLRGDTSKLLAADDRTIHAIDAEGEDVSKQQVEALIGGVLP